MFSFTTTNDSEIRRALFEGAVNYGAILAILADKGILTVEEVEAAKIQVRAELDQLMAARSEAVDEGE